MNHNLSTHTSSWVGSHMPPPGQNWIGSDTRKKAVLERYTPAESSADKKQQRPCNTAESLVSLVTGMTAHPQLLVAAKWEW